MIGDFNRMIWSRKALMLLWGMFLSVVALNSAYAQSVGAASAVNPIVDPLSEMTPSGMPGAEETGDGILGLDIEKLGSVDAVVPAFDVEVSSVSKQEGTIGKSPAAVFVITSEMIHRSGATCVPEALRMAPGVTVCKVNSCDWSVSIRGFNDFHSNKLLVLLDGRSVYNAIFSGVFWSYVDVPMDNIERIEVIRGPGGTLWGNNAVNGVINIITKQAAKTQGAYVSSGGGSQQHNISTVRYGGTLGKHAKYNIWGKYREAGPEKSPGNYDDWRQGRGGFRVDWNPRGSKNDLITAQGNFFGGEEGQVLTAKKYAGTQESAVQVRWEHIIDDESDLALQTYYDQLWVDAGSIALALNTFCFDFQHRFPIGDRHHLVWGMEYRRLQNYSVETSLTTMRLSPPNQLLDTTSWFIQDEIEVIEDKFNVTIGTKLENHCYTGFEYQPSIRGLWQFDDRHIMWGAISRAVRSPNIINDSGSMAQLIAPTTYVVFEPNSNLKSEDVVAYELGYREQTTKKFSWDVVLFCNVYSNLMCYTEQAPYFIPPNLYIPYVDENAGHGEAYGFEWTANWKATENWTLAGSYSYLFHQDYYDLAPGQGYSLVNGSEALDPKNQVKLQSYWSFAPKWQLDAFLRYVDSVYTTVPSYTTMDLRLGWRMNKNLEFSVVGQNLFDNYHPEMTGYPTGVTPETLIARSVFAKVTWTR